MDWTPLELNDLPERWRVVPFPELRGLAHYAIRQKALRARTSDGRELLVLRFARPLAALDETWFPVDILSGSFLVTLEACEGEPALPAGPASLHWRESWPELHLGPHRVHCPLDPYSRDWAWAWSPTVGPVILRLYIQRTGEEMAAWLDPRLWQLFPDQLWHATGWDDTRLRLGDGYFGLMRTYHQPPIQQEALEHFMLLRLCAGELGDFKWDLVDGDYYVFQASGETRERLYEYLHARAGRRRGHPFNRFVEREPIDALTDPVGQIAAGLGWEGVRELSDLCQRLRTASVPTLPRHLRVIARQADFDAMHDAIVSAQPRIIVTWELH